MFAFCAQIVPSFEDWAFNFEHPKWSFFAQFRISQLVHIGGVP